MDDYEENIDPRELLIQHLAQRAGLVKDEFGDYVREDVDDYRA